MDGHSRLRDRYRMHGGAAGVLLCLLLGLLPLTVVHAGGVTVTIEAPAEVGPASEFVARVSISGVRDFDIAQFDLSYDPDVLQVSNVTTGDIGGAAIYIDAWGHMPPGQPGTIRVIANVPGASGLSGSGQLAEVHFTVIGSACTASAVVLSNGVMGDKDGGEVAATWVGSTLRICPGPTPEAVPSTPIPTPVPVASGIQPPDQALENRPSVAGPAIEPSATRDAALVRTMPASEGHRAQSDPAAISKTARPEAGAKEPAVPAPATVVITMPLAEIRQADDTTAASRGFHAPIPSGAPRSPEGGGASTLWVWAVAGLGGVLAIAGGTAILRRTGGRCNRPGADPGVGQRDREVAERVVTPGV